MMVVEDLMEKTFFLRRKDITDNARDILAILDEYLFLSTEDQVSLNIESYTPSSMQIICFCCDECRF